ncbi:MAG: hypothetical protein R3Y28_02525 [Candidatus Gastranaerophilales bacterium]
MQTAKKKKKEKYTGTGQFGELVSSRRKKKNTRNNFDYLAAEDKRMRFNNSQDPIFYVFDCIENRSVPTLAKEFVKDSFFEIANFVAKAVL